MKKYNICVKKSYESHGENKTFWPSVGSLTFFPANGEKPDGYRLELNIFANTNFYVFEQKPKERTPQRSSNSDAEIDIGEGDNLDALPF